MVMLADGGSTLVYEVPLTEVQINQSTYCSGAAIAQKRDDMIHVVFFIEQPTVGGHSERSANLRVIMDKNGWTQAMEIINRAIRGKTSDE